MDKIAWIADEFKNHDRDHSWYTGLFLVGAILVAWGLYTNNIISTVLFVLITFVLWALSHRRPDKVLIQLTHRGLVINDVLYPYSNLKSFWIIYNPPEVAQLNFETTAPLNKHLSVELEDQDPDLIRDFLQNYVTEERDYEEHFVDLVIRKLRL